MRWIREALVCVALVAGILAMTAVLLVVEAFVRTCQAVGLLADVFAGVMNGVDAHLRRRVQ